MPIPFLAVATDIKARKEVWLTRGDLFNAIRASIAIPGVFTPQRMGDRWLVDGGLLNPVPVAPAAQTLSGITIAVDVTGPRAANPLGETVSVRPGKLSPYRDKIENFLESMQQALGLEASPADERPALSEIFLDSFETMQETLSRYKLAANPPDLLISIPRNTCMAHELYPGEELIEAGAWWARRALDTMDVRSSLDSTYRTHSDRNPG